jgi:hypothetical protein
LETIESLKPYYLFRGIDPDFALGRRAHLRYAVESAYASLTVLNPNGPEPFTYLEYAKADISTADSRGAINALSNAKRAVHLTIENFLKILGLESAYSKTNFPTKLEVIQELDAFPTRMIDGLNRKRNIVEHEYTEVALDEAADFVDIAEMLLLLAYPYLRHTVIGAYVGVEGDERCLEWSLNPIENKVYLYETTSYESFQSPIGKICYKLSGEETDRVLLDIVSITKTNQKEWLPFLDLFVYYTKKVTVRPDAMDYEEEGLLLYRLKRFYSKS